MLNWGFPSAAVVEERNRPGSPQRDLARTRVSSRYFHQDEEEERAKRRRWTGNKPCCHTWKNPADQCLDPDRQQCHFGNRSGWTAQERRNSDDLTAGRRQTSWQRRSIKV